MNSLNGRVTSAKNEINKEMEWVERKLFPLVRWHINKILMPGWHGGLMRWLSNMLTNACITGSIPTRDGQLCDVCMLLCAVPSFVVLPGALIYSYMGELTVWIVFSTVAIRMYRSSPLVPLDSCLTAAACLSSAC